MLMANGVREMPATGVETLQERIHRALLLAHDLWKLKARNSDQVRLDIRPADQKYRLIAHLWFGGYSATAGLPATLDVETSIEPSGIDYNLATWLCDHGMATNIYDAVELALKVLVTIDELPAKGLKLFLTGSDLREVDSPFISH